MKQTPATSTFSPENTNMIFTIELKRVQASQTYIVNCDSAHQLIFLIKGNMMLNSSESLDIVLDEGKFCLMPISSETLYTVVQNTTYLVVSFNNFPNRCEQIYMRELWQLNFKQSRRFRTHIVNEPFSRLLQEVVANCDGMLGREPEYAAIKFEEMLYVLRTTYSKTELATLFYSIASRSGNFRNLILSRFMQTDSIEELVRIWGTSRKSFDQTFNDEFGLAPYRWIRAQKARHVYYALSESEDTIKEVMQKYGFNVPAYFTRFCRDFFDSTPLELRKRLRIARYSHPLYS
ncbi:MAG: AraC family transcriptional regulator [Tannerellaceae bacterium]|jgi:AraC-like DNA-binding protein|nr:AraC family transcriptional regulator [Tannerellaceae bacterium]